MTFVSYAKSAEDVILHRALSHIEQGVYIDVGARDPLESSVTKAFYDRGWRGINIEPVGSRFSRFVEARPHDKNLNVAVGRMAGEKGTGCLTLGDVVEAYRIEDVHFLRIHAEGAEPQILEGLALDHCRPWIIVVSTSRSAAQAADFAWEPLLSRRDYALVYEDGENRFYLAHERDRLRDAFASPPNLSDDYVRQRDLAATEVRAAEVAGQRLAAEANRSLQQVQAQLDDSLSDPRRRSALGRRNVARSVSAGRWKTVVGALRRRVVRLAARMAQRLARIPVLRAAAGFVLRSHPRLLALAARLMASNPLPDRHVEAFDIDPQDRQLTVSARRVMTWLRAEMGDRSETRDS